MKLLRGVTDGLAQVSQHLGNAVEGKSVPFDEEQLRNFTDLGKIKKIYKLNASAHGKGPQRKKGQQQESISDKLPTGVTDERKEVEATVLGMMALRGAS